MKRALRVLFYAGFIAAVILFAYTSDDESLSLPVRGEGTGIVIAAQNEPNVIAPVGHAAVVSMNKNLMTHNGLFRIHYDTLEPIPDLVESWQALSDTSFEFKLREGVMFHTGEEMTADDVIASWTFARHFQSAAHESIVDFYAAGRYTVRLDTGAPNAMLFFDLTNPANMIGPRSLIESGHNFNSIPIGTGPFVFEEWRRGNFMHFTAFEDYFDSQRSANIDYVIWRFIPEGASRTIALEIGEVDFNMDVAPADIERLRNNSDIEVVIRPGISHGHLLLNNDRPLFSDVYVRRAIGMAINKERMVSIGLGERAVPTWSQVPAIFIGATEEGSYSFDPEGARALFAQHNIDPASLAFNIIASNEERVRMAEVIQADLAEISITVTITMTDLGTTFARTSAGDFDAAFGGFTANSLLGYMRGIFHHELIDLTNRSRIRSQELSDLIDQAVAEVDTDARAAILHEAVVTANNYTGQIPTHMDMVVRAFGPNITVPEISANGSLSLNMMYLRD